MESVDLPVQEEELTADQRVRLLPGEQTFFPICHFASVDPIMVAVLVMLDPTRRDSYLVLNSAGLFQVELPWIGRMSSVSEGE